MLPKTAIALSIALHELGTNAVKYSALSVDGGTVTVRWATADSRFRLRWEENGGPAVAPPNQKGFGSRMIERGLAAELRGGVHIDYRCEGVVCTIDAPIEAVWASALFGGMCSTVLAAWWVRRLVWVEDPTVRATSR